MNSNGAVVIGNDSAVDYVKVNPRGDTNGHDTTPPRGPDIDSGRRGRWLSEGIGQQLWRNGYATLWRCRRSVYPHAATGAVFGAGLAAEAITAAGAVSPTGMSAIIAAVAFPTAMWTARRLRKLRRRLGRRVLLGSLVAAGWLTLAPHGVGTGDAAVLLAAEYALAARWWQSVRLEYPTEPPAEEPDVPHEQEQEPEQETDRAAQIIRDWGEYVAGSGGPLPGSSLSLPAPTEHGYAFVGQVARGRQTLQQVVAALPRIATGLEVPVQNLIAESFPPDPVTGKESPSRFRFQVLERSPIAGDVDFDGPRREGGLISLGPWADGTGEAQVRLYTEGSMWSTVIIGGTGIGKSRVAENLVISAISGGDTVFWYLDPQGGASSPALAEHADWFGTMRDAEAMLDAGVAILEARGDENAVERWTGFRPSPRRPGLLIVVEECHNPFSVQEWTQKWTKIAREGRKVGVALLCISQYPGLETFGGSEALRLNVMAGNAIVLHTTSNSAGGLMAGLKVDPKTLPKIPGYAYMQGSEETGTRTAPFRNRNTTPGGDAGFAARWLAAQPQPALDTLAVTATLAAGTAYRDRHKSTTSGRAASAARVQALREGRLPEDMRPSAPQATQDNPVKMGKVITFPGPLTPDALRQPAPQPKQLPALSGSRLAIVEAVAAGAHTPKEIREVVGLGHRQVQDLLKELVATGHLVQPRHGRYERAA